MRGLTHFITTWVPIILFVAIVFMIYQEENQPETIYVGEGATEASELHPVVEKAKNELVDQASKKDIDVMITDEVRSKERQDELYARGRTTEGTVVTHAQGGESYHNYGLAIDYAIKNNNGNVLWDIHYDGNNNGESDWFEVAEIAKEIGFEWGGDWQHFKDYPHLQMTFGLSINELQKGYRPPPDK